MHPTPRPFLTVAALAAIGGFAAAGGCASKPTQPESTTAAKPAAKPQATPTDTGAPPGAQASAGGGASAKAADGAAVPPGRPQTSDERPPALDERLNDSLGWFDEQLRKERQQIARERDARQATVTTVAAVDSDPKPDGNQNGEAAETAATELPHKSSNSHRGATDSPSARSGDLKS